MPDTDSGTDKPTPELVGIFRRMVVLSGHYWTGPGATRAWVLTGGMFTLALAQIGIQIWLNFWNREFFNALEAKDWAAFQRQLLFFGAIVAASVACVALHLHVKRRLQREWREWLSRRLIDRWLDGGHHYQIQFLPGDHDNPDGRIAEDIRIATEYAVEFANSIFYCLLLLVSFLGILWTLSGLLPVTLGGITFNVHGYMVWVAIGYAALGTALAVALGRPLVASTEERQGREADFRFSLVRAREHGEAIALLRGEADERRRLLAAFRGIVGAWDRQTIGQRRLLMLTGGYSTLAVAVPLVVAAPRYFAGAIALGGLMQTAQAFVQVQTAMSWFVDNSRALPNGRHPRNGC